MAVLHRVRTEFTGLAGSPYLSTMYFNSAAGSAATATTIVAAFWNAIDAQQHTDLIWNVLADVEQVESTTGQIVGVVQGTPGSGVGASATEVLPFATQALIRWRTGQFVNGREVRGKTFIPGLTETAAAFGQLAGATETVLQNAANGLINNPSGFLVIYSRKNLQFAAVNATSVWNQFAVLRSRRD